MPSLRSGRDLHSLEQTTSALSSLRIFVRTRLRRCVVGVDRDRPHSDRDRHRLPVLRISGEKLADGARVFWIAHVAALADNPAPIRACVRDYLSQPKTLA